MSKIGTVEAEGYLGILNNDIIEGSYTTTDKVSVILAYILALQKNDNPITLGFVEGTLDLEIAVDFQDHPTLLAACHSVRAQVGGYLWAAADYDNPMAIKLRLEENIGEDKGQEIRWGKNIVGITKYEDGWKTATKIYPIGQVDNLPINLSALFTEEESPTKSADATYGYLTLSADYVHYKGWTSEGAALPDQMVILKDAVDDTANWVQGSGGNIVRCDIGDYGAGSTYLISYINADYLVTTPSGNGQPISKLYPRHDISRASDLLRAGQNYLDTLKADRVGYKIRLPMVSASGVDFELLQLGSIVNVVDEGLDISAATMIKRIRKHDLRHPERMEIDTDESLLSVHSLGLADEELSLSSMRMYDSAAGQFGNTGILGVGGSQLGGLIFTASDNYALRYVRIRGLLRGDGVGPSVVVAILEYADRDSGYYDGSAVLDWTRVGQGIFPVWSTGFTLDLSWSLDIHMNVAITSGVTYLVTVHAPYGNVGDGDYIASGFTYWSSDNGQNWSKFTYPPAIYPDVIGLEVYGEPREA